MKRCSSCKDLKPEGDFYARQASRDGLASRCKACDKLANAEWRAAHPGHDRARKRPATTPARERWRARNAERVRNYSRKSLGIPIPTRPAPDVCECCGGPPNGKGSLHADHDHATGIFRGWLCGKCNVGIGMLRDTLAGVVAAVKYLERACS